MSASNCPETPRQKMIQMMYLVYTAMLALNVSAEVVEGFKTVGNAMTKSNENMVTKLDDTYNNFEAALKNNPAKVKEKYDKAQEIKKLSNELVYTIDTVTYSFIGEITQKADISIIDPNDKEKTIKRTINLMNADGSKNFDSIAEALRVGGFSWIQKLDNNHIGTPYFIGKAEGKEVSEGAAAEVKRRIIEYKKAVKEKLGADSSHVALGLSVEDMHLNSEGKPLSWEQLNFNNTVAGAALVTLTRMKAEVMNAEFDAVNMLYKQIKSNDFSFDKVAVITRPKSSYIMQGGKYELIVNVGAYDSKAKFEATVGGTRFTANDTGAVVYSTVCNATGPRTVTGTVYVKNDNGTSSYDFKESYFVAEPMAVFELTEMNVVYSGIDNPVRISIPGIAAHNLVVSLADPNQATIVPDTKAGAGNYIIKPKVNKGKIKVNASFKDGNQTRFAGSTEFRARPLPDPKIYLGTIEAGRGIPINDLKGMKGPSVRYGPDFAFHMKTPTINKQTIDITKVNGATDIENRGQQWGAEVMSYIQKAKPGCKITLSIDVNMPDGTKRNISSTFRITR
jgi:gliding motility-associated protein GldM